MELETKLDLINDGLARNLNGKTFKNIYEIEEEASRRLGKKITTTKTFELYGKRFILSVWTKRTDNGLYVLSSMIVEIDTDEDVI